MSHRPGLDPNDWHASVHSCPDGLLKQQAWLAACKSVEGATPPGDIVSRARVFMVWLAAPFSMTESSRPFWRAVDALGKAIEDEELCGADSEATAAILKIADRWVAALAEWDAVP